MTDLVEFERELLQAMAGLRPAFSWGAAVGAALESLCGRRLVECVGGEYRLTDAGRAEATSAR